jgi:hypothetical protein
MWSNDVHQARVPDACRVRIGIVRGAGAVGRAVIARAVVAVALVGVLPAGCTRRGKPGETRCPARVPGAPDCEKLLDALPWVTSTVELERLPFDARGRTNAGHRE